jgi:hypothetical protein
MDWAGVDGMIDRADAGANSGIFEGKGGPYKVFVDSLFCTLSSGRAFFFVFCFHLVVENWWAPAVGSPRAQVVSHDFWQVTAEFRCC